MSHNIINIPNTSNTLKITAPNQLVITAPGPQGAQGPAGADGESGTGVFTETSGTTTDASATNVALTDALDDESLHIIIADIFGIESGGTDSWHYVVRGTFLRTGGTLSKLGSQTDPVHEASAIISAPINTVVANDTTKKIDAQLIGQAATTINWKIAWRVHTVAA